MKSLTICTGRLLIDNGVRVVSSVNNGVNKKDGSLEWSNMVNFESDGPFSILWERARDPFDSSRGFVLESCLHIPSPFLVSLGERSDSDF
jgi:hypothetical protein